MSIDRAKLDAVMERMDAVESRMDALPPIIKATREVVNLEGKSGWTVVSSAPDEASYRYASRALAEAHKAKLERFEIESIARRKEDDERRRAGASEYLEQRKAREAGRGVQLKLF